MTTGTGNPFAGKFIEVIARCAPANSEFLQDAEPREFGGVWFLVGVDCQGSCYRNGLQVWIALDDVAQISIFADRDDLMARCPLARPVANDSE